MRAGFGRNLLQNLAQDFGDQSPVAVNCAGAHGLRGTASNGVTRFTEAHARQKSRASVQIVCQRAEAGRDDTAGIVACRRDDVESDCCAKIYDNRWRAIECGRSGRVASLSAPIVSGLG